MKWVDTQEGLEKTAAFAGKASRVAVDTEADSLHSYFDKVCLIQLSAAGEDFIIDPLTKIDIRTLAPLFASTEVTKVFHGADYDLRIMHRDFGIETVNLVDTAVAAQLLGYEAFGLAALLGKHFGLELDKKFQRANWAMRPLTAEMLRYAVTDTRYLLELSGILERELRERGRWEWALEEFRRLETVRYRDVEPDTEAWRRLKGLGALDRRSLAAIERLYSWRDGLARAADVPPFRIMNNETLIEIAKILPASEQQLSRIRGVTPGYFARHGDALLAIVSEVKALPEEALPLRGGGKQWKRDPELERRIERLKKVRDQVARELAIEPAILAPKHVLASVAAAAPRSVDELSAIPALREWQKRLIGDALVKAGSI
jgi:ribonuclease D